MEPKVTNILASRDYCFVRSTPDNDRPPRRGDRTSDRDRTSDDRSTACGDAAGPIHSGGADDGACFHGAQGGEPGQQRQRDNHMFHYSSPWVAMGPVAANNFVAPIGLCLCKIAHFGFLRME